MIYVRRSDDISRLPMKPGTITRLRALGVHTIGEMFDDPRGVEEAAQWSDRIIGAGSAYCLLEWGAELPARSGKLYWMLEEHLLTVYGSGTMMDCTDTNQPPWAEFREEIGSVLICDGVTNVGAHAFENCPRLTSLELSADVRRIGEGAFRGCPALKEVLCTQELVSWREEPFLGPENTVTYIGHKAFEGTSMLRERPEDFYISHGILMEYYGSAQDIVIPEGVLEIAPAAFEGAAIQSVQFPKSLKRIGMCAFQNTRLQKLVLPRNLEVVDAWAFHNAAELSDVTLMNRSVEIDPTAFSGTPVAAYSQPVNGRWSSRWHLRLIDEPAMAPFRRIVVEPDPDMPFGVNTLNVRPALREMLFTNRDTLVQFFPNWHVTGEAPVRVHRSSWTWTPPDVEYIAEYLPKSLEHALSWWSDFPEPDEDAPISTAGLCRTRRKNMPVWYVISDTEQRRSEVGISFLKRIYADQKAKENT